MTRSGFVKIALIISVALNLIFAGLIIGALAKRDKMPYPIHLGWIMKTLDEETIQKIKPDLSNHARMVAPLRQEIANRQSEFNELLTDEELDVEEALQSLNRLRTASDNFQYISHKTMMGIFYKLTPDQRRAIAHYLQASRREKQHEPRRGHAPDKRGNDKESGQE